MQADLLVPRLMLQLKRARKNKRRGNPPKLPPVAVGDQTNCSHESVFDLELTLADYPPIIHMSELEPPGLLVNVDRGGDLTRIRLGYKHLGSLWTPSATAVTTRERHDHTFFAMTIAKIGYCYAVATLGLNGFDGTALRDLLCDRRNDVYDFVGGRSGKFPLTSRFLHNLYLREAGVYISVVVHLFAALDMPAYEVVVGMISPAPHRP